MILDHPCRIAESLLTTDSGQSNSFVPFLSDTLTLDGDLVLVQCGVPQSDGCDVSITGTRCTTRATVSGCDQLNSWLQALRVVAPLVQLAVPRDVGVRHFAVPRRVEQSVLLAPPIGLSKLALTIPRRMARGKWSCSAVKGRTRVTAHGAGPLDSAVNAARWLFDMLAPLPDGGSPEWSESYRLSTERLWSAYRSLPRAVDAVAIEDHWRVVELGHEEIIRVGIGLPHAIDAEYGCTAYVSNRLQYPVSVRGPTAVHALARALAIVARLLDDIGPIVLPYADDEMVAGDIPPDRLHDRTNEPFDVIADGTVGAADVAVGTPRRHPYGSSGQFYCPVRIGGAERLAFGVGPVETLWAAIGVVRDFYRTPPGGLWLRALKEAKR